MKTVAMQTGGGVIEGLSSATAREPRNFSAEKFRTREDISDWRLGHLAAAPDSDGKKASAHCAHHQ